METKKKYPRYFIFSDAKAQHYCFFEKKGCIAKRIYWNGDVISLHISIKEEFFENSSRHREVMVEELALLWFFMTTEQINQPTIQEKLLPYFQQMDVFYLKLQQEKGDNLLTETKKRFNLSYTEVGKLYKQHKSQQK